MTDRWPRGTIARWAGGLCLAYIVANVVASLVGKIGLSDSQTLRAAFTEDETTFRWGLVAALASAPLFVRTAWALYVLLRPLDGTVALRLLILNAVGVAVHCASYLPLLSILAQRDAAFDVHALKGRIDALALPSVSTYRTGFVTAQLFFSRDSSPRLTGAALRVPATPTGLPLGLDARTPTATAFSCAAEPRRAGSRCGVVYRCYKPRTGATMANKVVFIAFAKEDERARDLFVGQRKLGSTPYDWTDMSVKNPYDTEWKERVRTRIRRSDGVIALISSNTPAASGQLWEIKCAREEGKPLLGIWIEKGYSTKPAVMGTSPCKDWTWQNVGDFIDGL